MANVSQGFTVTWGTAQLGEVVSINVEGPAADIVEVTPKTLSDRNKRFRSADTDYGSVSLTLRGTAAMSATNVGLTAALSITGPGASFSYGEAIFESLGWAASVGELQAWTVKFKIGA